MTYFDEEYEREVAERAEQIDLYGKGFDQGFGEGNLYGRNEERAAIVKWLLSNPYQWEMDDREGSDYAEAIESGTHLRGDDE
jgi:hypothetical protein